MWRHRGRTGFAVLIYVKAVLPPPFYPLVLAGWALLPFMIRSGNREAAAVDQVRG